MASPLRGRFAPLLPWLLVAVWLALGYGALRLAWLTGHGPTHEAIVAYGERRIAALAADPEALQVVMLGSSILKHATRNEPEFDAALTAAAGRRAHSLRLVDDLATYAEFAPLAPALLAARPELLVLQAELLVQDLTWDQWQKQLRSFGRSRILEPGLWHPWGGTPERLQAEVPCGDRPADRDAARRRDLIGVHLRIAPEAPGPRAARTLVAQAQAAGIQVVVVDFPRSAAYRALVPRAPALDAARDAAVAAGAVALSFDGVVPDEQFCDAVHVDGRGRAVLSAWLAQRLAALAATPSASP